MGFVSYNEDIQRNIQDGLASKGLNIPENVLEKVQEFVWGYVSIILKDFQNSRGELALLKRRFDDLADKNRDLELACRNAREEQKKAGLIESSLRKEVEVKERTIGDLRRENYKIKIRIKETEIRNANLKKENEKVLALECECKELKIALMNSLVDRRL